MRHTPQTSCGGCKEPSEDFRYSTGRNLPDSAVSSRVMRASRHLTRARALAFGSDWPALLGTSGRNVLMCCAMRQPSGDRGAGMFRTVSRAKASEDAALHVALQSGESITLTTAGPERSDPPRQPLTEPALPRAVVRSASVLQAFCVVDMYLARRVGWRIDEREPTHPEGWEHERALRCERPGASLLVVTSIDTMLFVGTNRK